MSHYLKLLLLQVDESVKLPVPLLHVCAPSPEPGLAWQLVPLVLLHAVSLHGHHQQLVDVAQLQVVALEAGQPAQLVWKLLEV